MYQRVFGQKRFPLWGLIGSAIGVIFILVPMMPYQGTEGEPFSIFNHYVSELGEIGVSVWAPMFNIGLILAGITFIPFFIGLGSHLDNFIAKLSAVVGVYSSISIILVGIYPMNFLLEHYISAMSFFFSGMIMVILWAIAILVQKEIKIPKIFSIGALITGVIFAAFLFGTGDEGPGRPDFSLTTTLEWAIYFAVIIYLLSIALYVFLKNRSLTSSS
ncbi:MAG: DUF998 domain-containing protein [Candidatus Thorarchaeota archaeon]